MPRVAAVHRLENHDAALAVWSAAGVRDRVLVHVDAHHDLWWIRNRRSLTVANFISPALQEGLVREVVWVVPDGAFASRSARRELRRQVRAVVNTAGGEAGSLAEAARTITARVHGFPLLVCTLASLPRREEPVLLDCDVDFMILPEVAFDREDRHLPLPWIWPGRLTDALDAAAVTSDCATVAYSVEGGYTPLRWRSLGDELHLRLLDPESRQLAAYARLRRGDEAWQRHDIDTANTEYRAAAAALPLAAAPYRLALLELQRDAAAAACIHWRDAVEREPVYASAFRTLAWPYLWQGRYREAAVEIDYALALDPDDDAACAAMGVLAHHRRDWAEAARWWRRSLAFNPDNLDAERGMAGLAASAGEEQEAIARFERSLRLALRGHKPLGFAITTAPHPEQLLDHGHAHVYSHLARLHLHAGALTAADACYRMAIGLGRDGVRPRLRLAVLCWRRHQRRAAAFQLAAALRHLPASLRQSCRRGVRRLRISSLRETIGGLR